MNFFHNNVLRTQKSTQADSIPVSLVTSTTSSIKLRNLWNILSAFSRPRCKSTFRHHIAPCETDNSSAHVCGDSVTPRRGSSRARDRRLVIGVYRWSVWWKARPLGQRNGFQQTVWRWRVDRRPLSSADRRGTPKNVEEQLRRHQRRQPGGGMTDIAEVREGRSADTSDGPGQA